MGTVVCVGAGDLGGRVASLLVDAGHDVHVVRRSAKAVAGPVRTHRADLTDPVSLARVPWPVATALVVCVTAGRSDEAAYRAVFVDGVRNLLRALDARQGLPGRIVFVSSTAVYGQQQGELVTESSPAEPRRFNGRVLREAEAIVRATASPVVRPVCARLGGIYGPGRTRLLERVRRGEEVVGPGVPDPHTNRIHVEDAAAALAFLVGHPSPPEVVNLVDDHPARRSEVVHALARGLGVEVPAPRPGAPPAGTGGRDDDKRVSNELLRSLGYTVRYPSHREGYAALLAAPPSPLS